MATRPLFLPHYKGDLFVETINIDFDWFPGMSISQKQKSIGSLHESAILDSKCQSPLEISSKSADELGVKLSAFNLNVITKKLKKEFTVETAYQSSKVFVKGGPFLDLLYGTSKQAKIDPRLRESGHLLKFKFFNEEWPLEPKTAFYDWIYINALHKNQQLVDELNDFDAFTDIEFNPRKSINCQAYSVALYRSLQKRNLITDAINDRETYLDIVTSMHVSNSTENTLTQPKLI
jgi:hypothetical protein